MKTPVLRTVGFSPLAILLLALGAAAESSKRRLLTRGEILDAARWNTTEPEASSARAREFIDHGTATHRSPSQSTDLV
jgi:hypothetical protein